MKNVILLICLALFNVASTKAQNPTEANDDKMPIGAVVTSLLHYDAFMEVNRYTRSSDMRVVKWVPCDGRTISGSRYAIFSNGYAPDLRGVFLRGINEYNLPGQAPVQQARLNPENKTAGEFQKDAIVKHTHNSGVFGPVGFAWGSATDGISLNTYRQTNPAIPKIKTEVNDGGEDETRPKNITVYYYVKIN